MSPGSDLELFFFLELFLLTHAELFLLTHAVRWEAPGLHSQKVAELEAG